MKYENKVKINNWSNKYINSDNIKMTILFIPLLCLLIKELSDGKFVFYKFFSVSILVSFLFVSLCETLAKVIHKIISMKTEDAVKLTEDYEGLAKKYSNEKLIEINSKDRIPVIELCSRSINESAFDFEFVLSEKQEYQLPKQIADNSAKLFEAHKNSVIYNNQNVRITDIQNNQGNVRLTYGYTTFFDSLLTNRAMDYNAIGGRTIREIYEPGPFLHSLSKSKLSNHLGFNGFVELEDGNIIFVHRSKKVLIGKNLWAASVETTYKAKYGLEQDRTMSQEKMSNAIRNEIMEELKLEPIESDLTQYIIAFYRDLVEGGKPQFLFYFKCKNRNCKSIKKNNTEASKDRKNFLQNFKAIMKNEQEKRDNEKNVIVDGNSFKFFRIDDLRNMDIHMDGMKDLKSGKFYRMNPSTVASVMFLLKSLSSD